MFPLLLFKVLGIEAIQLRQYKPAVLADEHIVEVHLAAAVFGCLYAYEIPMYAGLIAVAAVVVAAARGKVEGSG